MKKTTETEQCLICPVYLTLFHTVVCLSWDNDPQAVGQYSGVNSVQSESKSHPSQRPTCPFNVLTWLRIHSRQSDSALLDANLSLQTWHKHIQFTDWTFVKQNVIVLCTCLLFLVITAKSSTQCLIINTILILWQSNILHFILQLIHG